MLRWELRRNPSVREAGAGLAKDPPTNEAPSVGGILRAAVGSSAIPNDIRALSGMAHVNNEYC